MLLVATTAAALAAGAPDYRGARVPGDPIARRVVAVAAGVGGAWHAGGNGAAWSGGFAQHLGVAWIFGETNALSIEADHARHTLVDAAAYYPDLEVPAGALSGTRDTLALDLGVRMGLDLTDETRVTATSARAYPFVRVALGAVFTDTTLDVPSFAGTVPLESDVASPMLGIGTGVEVRIRRWISVVPQVRAQMLIASDAGEVDGRERWGLEWRFSPGADVALNF